MRDRRIRVALLSLALSAVCGGMVLAGDVAQAAAKSYPGITRPSEERTLSVSFAGVVREVMVKEGDAVKSGQPLLRLDDRLDRNQLKQLEIDANSDLKVVYAKQEAAIKAVQWKRAQELAKLNAASPTELEEAELAAELSVTREKLSGEESEVAKLKAEGQRIKTELTLLTSTIDGVVQKIGVKEGEYADPQQGSQHPVCVVVKNDPLKVEVFLPVELTHQLKLAKTLEVSYAGESPRPARIKFMDPVADAGSGMRKLELELPNPEQREAGLQVSVRVPEQK